MLAIVFVHGLFWSGLLTAAGAYVTDLMPASRRAEGIGYYGISTHPRGGHRPRGRPLGLSARLALALRLHRHIEFDDGAYCDAVGGISTQYRRGGDALAVARSAGVAGDDRVADAVSCCRSATGASRASWRFIRRSSGSTPPSLFFSVVRGRDGFDAAVFGDAGRSHRSGEGAGAVSAADGRWATRCWRLADRKGC